MAVASRGVPEDYVPFHDGASSYNNFGARLESAQQVAGLLLQSHHVLSIGMADPSQISQQGNLWNPPGQHAPIANVAVTPMYGLDAGLALMPVPQPQSHQVNVTSFPVAGLSAAGSSASCTFPGNYQIPQTAAGCQENHSGGFFVPARCPSVGSTLTAPGSVIRPSHAAGWQHGRHNQLQFWYGGADRSRKRW